MLQFPSYAVSPEPLLPRLLAFCSPCEVSHALLPLSHPSPMANVPIGSVRVLTAGPAGRDSGSLSSCSSPSPGRPMLLATWPHCPLWVPLPLALLTTSSLALCPPENRHGCWTLLQLPLGPITRARCPCFPWALLLGQAGCFTGPKPGGLFSVSSKQSPAGFQQREQVPTHMPRHAPSRPYSRTA